MKLALITYHSNLNKLYDPKWIKQFKESILGQSYKNFTIYEMCYNGGEERIFENSIYESKPLPTFVHAMNYLIEKCLDDGAGVVANTNCDDLYTVNRLEIQMQYIASGYDLVSSNFSLIQNDKIVHRHKFENANIKFELNKNHNIIAHPVVVYSRKFLNVNKYVPEEIPFEDMYLWQRTIDKYRFIIAPENLLYQRIHSNSVCNSGNR